MYGKNNVTHYTFLIISFSNNVFTEAKTALAMISGPSC